MQQHQIDAAWPCNSIFSRRASEGATFFTNLRHRRKQMAKRRDVGGGTITVNIRTDLHMKFLYLTNTVAQEVTTKCTRGYLSGTRGAKQLVVDSTQTMDSGPRGTEKAVSSSSSCSSKRRRDWRAPTGSFIAFSISERFELSWSGGRLFSSLFPLLTFGGRHDVLTGSIATGISPFGVTCKKL